MYNRKKSISDSEKLDSSRVINMMREFETFARPYNQPWSNLSNHQGKTKPLRSPNFDDSDSTSDVHLVPKIRKLDVSPNLESSPRTMELRRKLLETERDLLHANATISSLKSKALSVEPEAKKSRIEYEKIIELKNQECESLKEKLLKLTNEKQLLLEQDISVQKALTEEKDSLRAELKKSSKKCQFLQNEKDELEAEMDKLRIDKYSVVKQLQIDLKRVKIEQELTSDEKCRLEVQIKRLMKQLQEKVVNETLKVNSELETKISNLESQLKQREEKYQVVNAMSEELKKLVLLEKECQQLRDENKGLRKNRENTFLLKEKLLSAQEQLANAQTETSKNSSLQMELHDLRRRLEKWEAVASSPSATSGFISQLQKSEMLYLEQIGKLKSELLSSKTIIIDLEGQVSLLRSNLKRSNQNTETQISNNKRLGRKLLLQIKECEGYKRIISSYESEITIGFDQVCSSKVQSLESLVETYKETISNYETEIKTILEKGISNEKSENEQFLETEVKKLQSQVNTLQNQVQGYESQNTPQRSEQIFHFRCNPVATAQQKREQEFKKLIEENEMLKARVQVLEMGNLANVTADAQKLLQEQGGVTIESLKEMLTRAEMKTERIMETFKKSSQSFREINYLLTGFKLNMDSNKFKLSHMYAESSQDFLMFEQTNDGNINLLETDYSKSVNHLISDYLVKFKSIPLFLSNITSELFYRQTSILDS